MVVPMTVLYQLKQRAERRAMLPIVAPFAARSRPVTDILANDARVSSPASQPRTQRQQPSQPPGSLAPNTVVRNETGMDLV